MNFGLDQRLFIFFIGIAIIATSVIYTVWDNSKMTIKADGSKVSFSVNAIIEVVPEK
jgi:hypothetical protein